MKNLYYIAIALLNSMKITIPGMNLNLFYLLCLMYNKVKKMKKFRSVNHLQKIKLVWTMLSESILIWTLIFKYIYFRKRYFLYLQTTLHFYIWSSFFSSFYGLFILFIDRIYITAHLTKSDSGQHSAFFILHS